MHLPYVKIASPDALYQENPAGETATVEFMAPVKLLQMISFHVEHHTLLYWISLNTMAS